MINIYFIKIININTFVNLIILRLEGNTGVAAYGVIANISIVVVAIYTGLGQGIQPLLSSAYGRGHKQYISQILKYSMITMVSFSLVIYMVLALQ